MIWFPVQRRWHGMGSCGSSSALTDASKKRTRQLNLTLPESTFADLGARSQAVGLRRTEYAAQLVQHDLAQVRHNEFAVMTMESPCYQMNSSLDVTDVNLSANMLFGMRQPDVFDAQGPITKQELVDILRNALDSESFHREEEHFKSVFDPRQRIDESDKPATVARTIFGEVRLLRRGVRLPDMGWSVVWNLRYVEDAEQFQRSLQSRIAAWRRGVGS